MAENEEWQNSSASDNASEGSREGYRPSSFNRDNSNYGGHSSYGRSNDRPQRPRFNRVERAYSSSNVQSSNATEGSFRPAGFGTSSEGSERRSSYGSSRPSYNQDRRGGYNNDRGGYQQRGGYNNNRGGYNNDRGGYNNERGGFQPRGGYNSRPSEGQEGDFEQQNGGYQREGGYQQRGGYGNNRGGGYGNNNRGGGYGNNRPRSNDYNPNAKYSMKKQIEYKEYLEDPDAPIRLNKFLANAGVCSRREADQFIQAGVVTVNGTVVTELGSKVQRTDEIHFHDQLVSIEKKVYVILNKPKDYVTTSDDPQQRKTVMDLVKNCCRERIYPVGRLDRNTTGVLLFTNDGDLASKLTHPKFLKKKIYHVYLDKNCTQADMKQIAEGITLEDGDIKADAISYASDVDRKQVGIEIHSGKNRIVRRIFESLGYKVCKLDRVMFAGLTKKGLKRGDWRFLTEKEVAMLHMGAFE